MEELYRKKSNGRYQKVGYSGIPDLTEGIWMVQDHVNGKSTSSLIWKVGDLKRPADITTHVAFQSIFDEIVRYVVKLTEGTSEEFEKVKKELGGWIRGNEGIGVYNISPSDFATIILRKIATYFEKSIKEPDFRQLLIKFRNEKLDYNSVEYDNQVKMLYSLAEYLEDKGYAIQKKTG